MATLEVSLGERSYPIYIDAGLLSDKALLAKHISGKRVCIVSNDVVFPLYGEAFIAKLSGFEGANGLGDFLEAGLSIIRSISFALIFPSSTTV